MDWERFDTHGEDKREAFEAFVCQLFERFCRRAHGLNLLDEVRLVNGDGGDGGVEAYALVRAAGAPEPDVVGVQAKWFRDPLTDTQVKQIDKSFQAARQNHPRLRWYFVAIPRNLGDKRAGTRKSERDRWEAWATKARREAPGTAIKLWDEGCLERELNEPENGGVHAYWFEGSVFTLDFLSKRFDREKEHGWLRRRYFPELHAPIALERDLALRLGAAAERKELVSEVDKALAILWETSDAVARLPSDAAWRQVPHARELVAAVVHGLAEVERAGRELAEMLRRGRLPVTDWPVDNEKVQSSLRSLERALTELDSKAGFSAPSTREIQRQIERYLGHRVTFQLWERWGWWQHSRLLCAYTGAPGIGKTHGLAHVVERCLAEGHPALLLRARDCPIEQQWMSILQPPLDRPGASLGEMLRAMEATAIRADVRRARDAGASTTENVERGPTYFLLAIDGLDESGRHRSWAERLAELAAYLDAYPRLRAAVTIRSACAEEILEYVRKDRYSVCPIEADENDVEALLEPYCRANGVPLPDHRIRWALRDPLSVRLYCELRKVTSAPLTARSSLTLPHLLRRKIELCEEEIQTRLSHGRRGDTSLRILLDLITKEAFEGRRLRRAELIDRASAQLPSFREWNAVLGMAEEQGILMVSEHGSADPLEPTVVHVEAAHEPLLDYLIARHASQRIAASVKADPSCIDRLELPGSLRNRHDARTQMATLLLADHGISLVRSGLFHGQLRADEIERLELCAIAALDGARASEYRDWVRNRLCASMPSCRRVLKDLCIPVSRDPDHPLGPKFLHASLLPFLPAKRDLFWSGPRFLPGDSGAPWEGQGDLALEHLTLRDDDVADGPPLLLAWALTSVDNPWRARVRAALAQWGGRNIAELVRWLGIVTESNDPQMLEDVAMVAFGAAILSGTDPRLGELVRWVDENWLMLESPRRRENIVVLHAARGVVERARAAGISENAESMRRARSLYATDGRRPPVDVEAAKLADVHDGVEPIRSDLAWYVVPRALHPFFSDPRKSQRYPDPMLADYGPVFLEHLAPQCFAFGVVMAHLREAGWNEEQHHGIDVGAAAERLGMDIPSCGHIRRPRRASAAARPRSPKSTYGLGATPCKPTSACTRIRAWILSRSRACRRIPPRTWHPQSPRGFSGPMTD